MSADIEIRTDGTAATLNADWFVPWHGMGDIVDAVSIAQLWDKLPELAAIVKPEPLYRGNGEMILDRVANVREATARITPDGVTAIPERYVGTVSTTYQAIQNREAFEFITDVLGNADDARIASAGSLNDGRRTWVAVHLGSDYLIPGDAMEQRDRYLMFANSFDASMSFSVVVTDIRVVCANTLNAALRAGRVHRIRHTANARDRVSEARDVLGIAEKLSARTAETAQRWADITMTDAGMGKFLEALFPTKTKDGVAKEGRGLTLNANRQAAVMDIYTTSPTVGDKRGTVWGAFNAVTAWDEHVRKATPDTRFRTAILDGNRASDDAAAYLAREYAPVAV